MKNIYQSFKTFWADEDGATAIEYGLLASLIAVAIIASVDSIGDKLILKFNAVATALT